MRVPVVRSEKKSLNIKLLGGIFLGYPGPRRRDIPDKNFMQVAFSVVLDREWPGCPGIWVGMSRIWKNFMQENFGLIFRTLCWSPWRRGFRVGFKGADGG